MKKSYTCYLLCVIMLLATALPACKKSDLNNGSAELKNLLVGAPGKVWQLQSADASDVWEDQIGKGWVEYTNQPGNIVLTDCVKNNDYIVFNADGTYTQSTYTCNLFESNYILAKQIGGTGNWTLGSDNGLELIDHGAYRLISVNATDLVIANLWGTSHFVRVNKLPFLTPTDHLAGAATRTWKINKITQGGVAIPLTAAQITTKLIFNINGSLTTSNDALTYSPIVPNYAQPVTGTWNYNVNQNKYSYTYPASGQLPAVNQSCVVLELTETAFTYYFFDSNNNYYTVYLVPAA